LVDGNPSYSRLTPAQRTPVIAKSMDVLPDGRTKISAHIVYPRILSTLEDMKRARELAIHQGCVDKEDAPDIKAYGQSQKMRLPLFPKSNDDRRMLIPEPGSDYEDHIISYINHEEDSVVIKVDAQSRGRPRSKNPTTPRRTDDDEDEDDEDRCQGYARKLLECCGFASVEFKGFRPNPGEFIWDFQDEEAKKHCPLCGGEHDSTNNYVLKVIAGAAYLFRHTDKCTSVDLTGTHFMSPETRMLVEQPLDGYDLSVVQSKATRDFFERRGVHYVSRVDGNKIALYRFMGHHWTKVKGGQVIQDMRACLAEGTDFHKEEIYADILDKLMKKAGASGHCKLYNVMRKRKEFISADKSRNALINDFAHHVEVPGNEEVFDTENYVLHFTNGYVDLRTMEFNPVTPKKLNTKFVPYDYPEDVPEVQLEFVRTLLGRLVRSTPEREWLLRLCACCLDGDVDLKAFGILTDSVRNVHEEVGSNGKSTFIRFLADTLGTHDEGYAVKMSASDFEENAMVQSNAHTSNLLKVVGRRMAYADELSERKNMDVEGMKNRTGGDNVFSVRPMYEPDIKAVWRATVFMVTNNLGVPKFHGDPALEQRMLVFPFETKFTSDARIIQEDERRVIAHPGEDRHVYPMDQEMGQKLQDCRPAFMRILLDIYPSVRSQFTKDVVGPKPLKMQNYISFLRMKECRAIMEFFDTRLEIVTVEAGPLRTWNRDKNKRTALSELQKMWRDYSQARGTSSVVSKEYVLDSIKAWIFSKGLNLAMVMRKRDQDAPATGQERPSDILFKGLRMRSEEMMLEEDDGVDRVDFCGGGARQVFLEDFGPAPKRSRTEV